MPRDPYARRRNPLPLILAVLLPFVAVSAIVVAFRLAPAPERPPAELPSAETGVTSSVFIPLAEWDPDSRELRVAGLLTARVDATGTCTLVAQDGSDRLSVEGPATPDASTMTCGTMVLTEGVHPGVWTVTISYTSGDFEAVSESRDVEVRE